MKRAAFAVALLVLAGCGSSQNVQSGPKLPSAFADHLIGLLPDRSLLQRETIAAINAHQVPAALQEELLGRVNGLRETATGRAALEAWLRGHGASARRDDFRLDATTRAGVDTIVDQLVQRWPDALADQWSFLAQLTPGQRALLTFRVADDEINNGGTSQLFVNETPAFAAESAAGARLLGLPAYAQTLRIALDALPRTRPYPRTTLFRDPADATLQRADDRWYALERHGAPDGILGRFVERHPNEFFRR